MIAMFLMPARIERAQVERHELDCEKHLSLFLSEPHHVLYESVFRSPVNPVIDPSLFSLTATLLFFRLNDISIFLLNP